MYTYIDISTHQKNVDYAKVKADGIVGVILRVGHTGYSGQAMYKDEMFEKHYAGFKAVGLPMGVYWFSRANSSLLAIKEAQLTLKYIQGKEIKLPVYFDTEDSIYQEKLSVTSLSIVANAFCSVVQGAGYTAGIYASKYWLENRLNMRLLEGMYEVWIAQYNSVCTYNRKYQMWQYTSKGIVNGISGDVDMNSVYKAYHIEPTVINGAWTEELTRDLQVELSTYPDGIISGQFKWSGIENINIIKYGLPFGSQLVRAIQRLLKIRVDGYMGINTIKALQRYYGTVQDGYISENSQLVRAMRLRKMITGRYF